MANDIRRGFFNKFNRGEVSPEAFAREEVTRVDNSCELMENFMPMRLGPMTFRPGTEVLDRAGSGVTVGVDDESWLMPFPTSIEDPVMLVFFVNSGLPSVNFIRANTYQFITRTAVTSGWTNGDFSSALGTGWTDVDEGSATSVVAAGVLRMTGTGTDSAKVVQTTATTEASAAHAFRCTVEQGQVLCQIGTNGQDSADLFEGFLEVGQHHLEVDSPSSGDITVTLSNGNIRRAEVEEFELLGAVDIGVLLEDALRTNIMSSSTSRYQVLRSLRKAQSADVMYFAGGADPDATAAGWMPFMIKRWNDTSFSVQRFVNVFGPYLPINITNITMNPTAPLDGNTEVVASKQYFDFPMGGYGFGNTDDGRGVLIKLAVTGQTQTATGSDNSVETEGIFVFGTGNARRFTVDISTTGAYNEVYLEKSFDEITWQRVKTYSSGANVNEVYDDGLDAAETFYRLQVEDIGAATSITLTLSYDFGTLEAQGRITQRDSETDVEVEWYVPLNEDQTVVDWFIGAWGGKNPMPSAIAFHEGRLWFAGGNRIWGSESDFYESFDALIEGNSASIQRTIGFGAAERIHWLAPSARLVAGTPVGEIDIRSSAFGEVLTPVNANLKAGSDLGTADIEPIVVDNEIFFVQRGATKLIAIDFNLNSEKHSVEDFNMLNNDILRDGGGVLQIAYVRNPETRIFCVMADGTLRVLNRDFTEGVLGWSRVTIVGNNGVAETVVSVATLPSEDEDEVWITTDSQKILRFAPYNLAEAGNDSRHFDAFLKFTSPGGTISLPLTAGFVNGHTVGVWVDGVDDGDYVIASQQITGVTAGTDVVVGYRYEATYLSNKLTDYSEVGVLGQRKRIMNTGLLMRDYVTGAVTIGPSLSDLGNMPELEAGKPVVPGEVINDYDFFPFVYNGTSETDPRIAIKATGPTKILAYCYDVKNTASKTRTQGG